MIFATVGSQKFPFDRLLQAIDQCLEDGSLEGEAFAQTGCSAYEPKHYGSAAFLDGDSFAAQLDAADVVITHGGTGSIIGAVKRGKKVIAVPRLSSYGEHVDDHQVELVERFAERGHVEPCFDMADLPECYRRVEKNEYRPYQANTKRFLADLDGYLHQVGVASNRERKRS